MQPPTSTAADANSPVPSRPSLPARCLGALARAILRRPALFIYPQAVLFVLCVAYTARFLEFSTSRNDLVDADKRYHQNFLAYKAEFQSQDDLVAVVESEDTEKNRQFVERLGRRLEAETNVFTDVFFKGDLTMMGRKALLFVPEDDLRSLLESLRKYRPFIDQFSQATDLNSLFRLVNHQFRSASQQADPSTEAMVEAVPALQRIIEQAGATLDRSGVPPSPGLDALLGAGPDAERGKYITFDQGRFYLVSSRPIDDDSETLAVKRLRTLVEEVRREVPGVNVGITGESVLEYDEMRQSQKDTVTATGIALLLVALIFIYGFRETGRPIKATLCLVVGLGYTMAYTTATVGHLNILTITFVPILVGLAIDFGVHLIARYEEELRRGGTRAAALENAIVHTGLGIFTGCFTTAGAFFAMALTEFKGIKEMGIITGGGIMICLIPLMTMLPALLLRGRQNRMDREKPPAAVPASPPLLARISRATQRYPKSIVLATVALCLAAVEPATRVRFDYNLLNMQSAGLPAVVIEKKLIESAEKSVLFGVVIADSAEQANELQDRLAALPTVASIDSMSRYLEHDPERQLNLIRQIRDEARSVSFPQAEVNPVDLERLNHTLWALQGYLGLALRKLQNAGQEDLQVRMRSLREEILAFRSKLQSENPQSAATKLGAYQRALFADLRDTFGALRGQDTDGGLRVDDLPDSLRNRFVGKTGRHLLQVYPREDVWEREPQERFIRDLRSVDQEATGTPIQLYEYTNLLKESYEEAAGYALAAIILLVFVHFRSVGTVLLALIPVGVGALWMVGLMGIRSVPFNPANIMTLPLVIGIGVTNGIHILNRVGEDGDPAILGKSTGRAVLISALTTMAGFGSLILAEHQGIASLGYVMTTGVAACMVAALMFLPAVLRVIVGRKKPSGDNARSTLGREEPR